LLRLKTIAKMRLRLRYRISVHRLYLVYNPSFKSFGSWWLAEHVPLSDRSVWKACVISSDNHYVICWNSRSQQHSVWSDFKFRLGRKRMRSGDIITVAGLMSISENVRAAVDRFL
jgi:hypothetical protein